VHALGGREEAGAVAETSDGSAVPEYRDFADFYRDCFRHLVIWAVVAGAPPDRAEDYVQDVMVAMLRLWPEIRYKRAFAHRSLLNNIKDVTGDKRYRSGRDDVIKVVRAGLAPRAEGGLDSGLTVWEDEGWVRQVLAQLTPDQRTAMEGHLEGLTSAEIGEVLGATDVAIRKRLEGARRGLKRYLAELEHSEQPQGPRGKEN
jgi:RNA polymerase sigma factor (sigma-70 family)